MKCKECKGEQPIFVMYGKLCSQCPTDIVGDVIKMELEK